MGSVCLLIRVALIKASNELFTRVLGLRVCSLVSCKSSSFWDAVWYQKMKAVDAGSVVCSRTLTLLICLPVPFVICSLGGETAA